MAFLVSLAGLEDRIGFLQRKTPIEVVEPFSYAEKLLYALCIASTLWFACTCCTLYWFVAGLGISWVPATASAILWVVSGFLAAFYNAVDFVAFMFNARRLAIHILRVYSLYALTAIARGKPSLLDEIERSLNTQLAKLRGISIILLEELGVETPVTLNRERLLNNPTPFEKLNPSNYDIDENAYWITRYLNPKTLLRLAPLSLLGPTWLLILVAKTRLLYPIQWGKIGELLELHEDEENRIRAKLGLKPVKTSPRTRQVFTQPRINTTIYSKAVHEHTSTPHG